MIIEQVVADKMIETETKAQEFINDFIYGGGHRISMKGFQTFVEWVTMLNMNKALGNETGYEDWVEEQNEKLAYIHERIAKDKVYYVA